MGDLTDGSSRWWTEVMTSLDAFYKDYVGASPVRKVQLKAEDYSTAELKDPKWMRLDKRAASMLLQAALQLKDNKYYEHWRHRARQTTRESLWISFGDGCDG
eukprot:s946_g1.t1